jgi:hypothetical protein
MRRFTMHQQPCKPQKSVHTNSYLAVGHNQSQIPYSIMSSSAYWTQSDRFALHWPIGAKPHTRQLQLEELCHECAAAIACARRLLE